MTASILLIVILLFSCENKKEIIDEQPESNPEMTVTNMSQPIAVSNTVMQFYVNLSKPSSKIVTVDYFFTDGSAKMGKDYMASSGTLSFPPQKTQVIIDVEIKGDLTNLRRPNPEFNINFTNPKNCNIATTSAKGIILTEDGTYLPTENSGYSTPSSYTGYTLNWSDEFNNTTLDNTIWNHEIGNGNSGWGNNELEYYTSNLKNSFVSAGNLIIEARKESIGGFNYSSSRITTQGKKSFKFGRIDIRAKLPVGKGIWPALWMLGTNISNVGWPACGEIDIMELIGTYPSRVTGTMHWKNLTGSSSSKGNNYEISGADFSQQFHVFSIIWEKDMIKWYVDDILYHTNTLADVSPANYPFNAEQFFIFNVAVGGNWPGSPDATTVFPQRMFIDYVRVFQK